MEFCIEHSRYPSFTEESSIQCFRGDVVRGNSKGLFKSYCQRVMATVAKNNGDRVKEGQNNLLNIDCLEITLSVLDEKVKNFTGAQMIFLDLPKVCIQCFDKQLAPLISILTG